MPCAAVSALRICSTYLAPRAPLDAHQGSLSLRGPCSPDCGQRPLLPGAGTTPHPSWCHLCALFAPDFLVLWGLRRDRTRARSLMALGTSGRNQSKHWFCTIGKALYVPVSLLNRWEVRLKGGHPAPKLADQLWGASSTASKCVLGLRPHPAHPEQGRGLACGCTSLSGTCEGSPSHPAGATQAGASVTRRSGHKAMGPRGESYRNLLKAFT